jgi:hypothetical protein
MRINMARKKRPPISESHLPPEVYEQCCMDLQEAERIRVDVQRACRARVNGAEGAMHALDDICQRNQLLIEEYFPGQPIPATGSET